MGAELLRLGEGAAGQRLPGDARGKAEVVLDARAGAGLPARPPAVEHGHGQPFGRGVNCCGQPGRASTDHCHVVDVGRIELGNQAQARGQVAFVRITQHGAVRADHEREIVRQRRQAFEQRDGLGVHRRVERGVGEAVAPQEVLQREQPPVVRRADQHHAVAALDHQHAAQDQRAHDGLADVGLADHHRAEFVGAHQHGLHVIDHARIHHGRLVRQLRHVRGELAALGVGVEDALMAQPVAPDDPHLAGQQQEHARAQATGPIEVLTGGKVRQAPEAAHALDVLLGQHGEHLRVARMFAHAGIILRNRIVDHPPLPLPRSASHRYIYRPPARRRPGRARPSASPW
ncbi:hypothetical protein D3C81_904010 [compost metagenome]